MTEPAVVVLPLWLPGLILILAAGVLLAVGLGRRWAGAAAEETAKEERDWSIPELAVETVPGNLFQRWDTRIKLATLLGYAFLVVSLHRPGPAAAAVLLSAVAVLLARIPSTGVLKRTAGISGFLLMLALIMPLTVRRHPGDPIVVIAGLEFLTFNPRGLALALTIGCKALAVALLMEPMLATSALGNTLEALARLGVPVKLTQMVLLSHRYLHVFAAESQRMQTAMRARGFKQRTDRRTLQTVANFLGMLFVRSFDRTQRVQDAMLARGFTGRFPVHHRFAAAPGDWLLAVAWLSVGVILLLFDRFGL